MLRSKETVVPRSTSVPTASFIALFSVARATLGLYFACCTEAISALMWLAVVVWRAPHVVRDWTEDFSHENGNYHNRCVSCDHSFLGHKRRVVCRACSK